MLSAFVLVVLDRIFCSQVATTLICTSTTYSLHNSLIFTMNRNIRTTTLLVVLFVLGLANAFVPVSRSSSSTSKTSLQFGFLKELGLEKPSWLPDFGGKEDVEPVAPVAEETDTEEEEGKAEAAEE